MRISDISGFICIRDRLSHDYVYFIFSMDKWGYKRIPTQGKVHQDETNILSENILTLQGVCTDFIILSLPL